MAIIDKHELEPNLAEAPRYLDQLAPIGTLIHDDVISEAIELGGMGFDVRFEATPDYFAVDPIAQVEIAAEIADLEERTSAAIAVTGENPLLLPQGRKAFEAWKPLTKRAIALKNIYEPESTYLGEGIDPNIYSRPLFIVDSVTGEHISASDMLELQIGPEKAAKIVDQYHTFISAPIDEASRRIWQGALDGAGVRTRATSAMQEVTKHLSSTKLGGEAIVTASLACGAASPVYQLMKELDQHGLSVERAILADMDVMALASAYSLAEREGVADRVALNLENLVDMENLSARKLTEFIEPHSVDVVDLLGIFEYFPPELAIDLLKEVKEVLKPGGIIVFGNMLDKRPQQTFFTDVSLWPPLYQRSLKEIFGIIDEAGFDSREDASIILPPQGVYAVVAIRT